MILKNARRLLDNGQLERCDVLIEGEKIKQIAPNLKISDAEIVDCNGQILLPGLIDVHIHLREPGGEHKETIKTGTNAAARGGFTTVCAMPNTNPVPDSLEIVTDINKRIEEDAVVRVLPYGSITKNLQGEQLTDMSQLTKAGVFAFTDDGVGIQRTDIMLKAMKTAAKLNMPIVAHCEDNSVLNGGVIHEGEVSKRLGLPGIPSVSESVQIARDVLLAKETGCHYHVCHVSTKESVGVIRAAKAAGISVTAEVTPHHLLLNERDITTKDANYKMNPPLRSEEDQQALLEGLLDGTIDIIATDHAPHTEEEKSIGMIKAPFGIVGLETAFPLLYTYLVKPGILSLKGLVDRMTKIPADIFSLPYGKLEEGSIADLTLVDLNKQTTINKHDFVSKSKNTPFHNWKVSGIPTLTIFEGKIVYQEERHGN